MIAFIKKYLDKILNFLAKEAFSVSRDVKKTEATHQKISVKMGVLVFIALLIFAFISLYFN